MMKSQTIAIGVFPDASRAQEAIRALQQAGFREEEIGVVSPQPEKAGGHAQEVAVAGVATGAGVGTLWALGIAVGVLPGIGPVVAGGLLGSILASAAGGAAVGGVLGGLIGLGIPEDDARYYEKQFMAGRTLVTVQAPGRAGEAWAILEKHTAYNRRTASREAQQ